MMRVEISKKIASRIKTVDDLNDFYAYMERDGYWDEDEDEPAFSYSFPEDECDRIDELCNDIDYCGGEYDETNIERILKDTTKDDLVWSE